MCKNAKIIYSFKDFGKMIGGRKRRRPRERWMRKLEDYFKKQMLSYDGRKTDKNIIKINDNKNIVLVRKKYFLQSSKFNSIRSNF